MNMSSRHNPNENERQPNRFGFRSRLQTIMEVDGSACKTPGGKEPNKPRERGTKRPVSEMNGNTVHNSINSHADDSPSTGKARRCLVDRSASSRPGRRCAPNRITTTPPAPTQTHQRIRVEVPPACPAELQRKNMRSSAQQVPPSGGGIPKLVSARNKCNLVIDDQQRTTHKQLLKEHLQLQKSFALWRQLVEEAQSHQGNEELASWAEEKEGILKSTKALQSRVDELQEKLTEYREQNELLEFRILELDHCQNKQQCPPCELEDAIMTSPTRPEVPFCSTGCTQPQDPCLRLFHEQVALYQDLDFKAEELLEELRHLSSLPGLNCVQRSALARSAACVSRCKGDVRTALNVITSPPTARPPFPGGEDPLQHGQSPVGNHLDWLEKLLFGVEPRPSSVKNLEDEELSDQSLLQETSMTESEIGQALMSEWAGPLTESQLSQHKMVEHQHSEDEGLGEDSSRRSTEPNSLISEEPDNRALVVVVEELRRKNDVLITEIRQAEILVRALKVQADRVQDLECQLSKTERERSEYQEQILELEEAENDARLESQTLRTLVDNLRQHEDDLEKSLSETRDRLEEYEKRASVSGATAEELRAQIGYLEELVYKYEEHIEGLEKAEGELRQKLAQTKRVCVDVEVQVEEVVKDCSDASVQVSDEDHPQCRCSEKKDLLSRLQSLEERDGVLREQLHQVDGINLKLWQKLHCLETDIGECKRQEGSWGPEQHHREAAARLEGLLGAGSRAESSSQMDISSEAEAEIAERVLVLECNERKLREQLLQLERINQDFERELEIRERLNRDKEMEQARWTERESELRQEIQGLELERFELRQQTADLEAERSKLRESLEQLQEEYGRLKLAHCQETQDLHARHQEASKGLQDTSGPEEEEFRKVMRLSQEALQLKTEQQELRSQVAEMSLAFETELRALRACHELEEKRFHDEMVSLRCKDDKCCARVQSLAVQRERLESNLTEREQQLQALEAEFQRKSLALDEERRLVEGELQRKMKEMEENTSSAVMELKEKRRQLEQNLRVDMEDLRSKESSYKVRIHELERHVDSLRREVTDIVQGSQTYETEEDVEYQLRIEELEKKEAAYVETLENADQIISQMELRYRDNIQRLESSERSLQERVKQLEASDAELRTALHNERRTSDGWKTADLLRELMEAEARENSLKEHADELEISHKAMLQKVRDLERSNQHISEELRDHEEASLRTGKLSKDLETLREEVTQLRRSEAALKETLVHADSILAQREQALSARVKEMEAEKQGSEEMVSQLREQVRTLQEQLDQSQICHLEQLVQRTDSSSGVTKETQTESIFYCNSRSVTAPVSPASSVEDLSSYHTPEDRLPSLPHHMPPLLQGPEEMLREEAEEEEDASRLGMEERLALEHCMKRAMAAMERDMQRKVDQHHLQHQQVFHHRGEDEEDDEEEERTRMPPSPACSSTSGCESDCSSSGGSCRWPLSVPPRSGHKNREDPYGSDEDHQRVQTPERHTVTSKELPTLMKTRIIYPSITKIEVKDMPTLVTRHSEFPLDVNKSKNADSLPEPPGDFCILRRVGRDSLLVGWTPPQEPQIQSYQIFVDGELQQKVRSPDRTKALLHKLDLTRPLTIAIRSMQTSPSEQLEGRQVAASEPALLTYQPTECQK